jgi:2-polyprenyl-6-hydroxyphenyl methylase / 3-demethylubiquinone-9 3-methyltransferase
MSRLNAASVARDEIARFSAKAGEWWNPEGAFGILHRLGPLRTAYIKEQVAAIFGRQSRSTLPFRGLRFLDVGCGGGLIAEEIAKLGGRVTGIDASRETIGVARCHAAETGLDIVYHVGSVEKLAASKDRYDVVVALEVVEHVADLDSFLGALARVLRPGGLMIVSTLNRTLRSYFCGVLAAEYLLGWVPPGTHQWSKFRRPSELLRSLEALGFKTRDLSGMAFDPIAGTFHLDPHKLAVNYLLTAVKHK